MQKSRGWLGLDGLAKRKGRVGRIAKRKGRSAGSRSGKEGRPDREAEMKVGRRSVGLGWLAVREGKERVGRIGPGGYG